MYLRLTLPCLLIISCTLNAQLWLVDPLETVYPDTNQLDNYSHKWNGDFPLGTSIDVHILVKLPVGEQFTLSASKGPKKLGIEVWSQLVDVPVEQNTGLDSRTEQFKGKVNPYVVRRAPFRVFEVIRPLKTLEITSVSTYSAFRLSLPPAMLAEEGTHKIKINVTSKSFQEEGFFSVNIHPIEQPKLSESRFFYTNWFNLNQMEVQHDVDRWSEPWFKILDSYAKMMAHGRQNAITVPSELIQYNKGQIILKDSLMLRYINIFRFHGFKYFESPHLMNRGENDDWADPELKVSLTGKRYTTENGREDIEKIMTLIKEFTTKNKLTKNWLQHISDEPTSANAASYRKVAQQVKRIFPEVKIMEATNDRDNLVGAVDIWCPLINDFQQNEAFFREREAKGEEVLVYTCLIPGGKWLNRTLDMEKLRQVYFGWGTAFYNTAGYLHWGLNQYQANPFTQSVVKHPSPAAGPNNYLPAGDTHVIYPGEEGPLSSIRFEAHRMGIEDYDLLQILKDKNENKSARLIGNLFRSFTEYNLSIKKYRKTKKKLLQSLN